MNLFGKLVPTLLLADPCPQLPAPRLGDLGKAGSQGLQPLGDELSGSETRQAESEPPAALGHHVHRPPQPPVTRTDLGYVRAVDASLVVSDTVIGEDRADVEVVLFVGFDDLQLQYRQVGKRNGQRNDLEPALEVDSVTEVRLIDEHVHLAAVVLVPEEQTAVTVEHVELTITGITKRSHQGDHSILG